MAIRAVSRHKAMARSSPQEWQTAVVANLSNADGAHRQAVHTLQENLETIKKTNTEYNRQRDNAHDHFFHKIENTRELRQQLTTRILSVSKTIEHSEWSLQKLMDALAGLRDPLELCRSRLTMRERRPKRELVNDPFQEALMREQKDILNTKACLSENIADSQRVIGELMDRRAELQADLHDKSHALEIDRQCLERKKAYEANHVKLDKAYNRTGVPLKMVLPEVLGKPDGSVTERSRSACGARESEGRNQERTRQIETLKGIDRGLRLEQAAKAQWQKINQVLDGSRNNARNAFKSTQQEMGAKIERTELLRQELMKQRKMTEARFGDAVKTHTALIDKLTFIEKPIAAAIERNKIRGRRTPRELIADEVTEAVQEQLSALESKRFELRSQVSAAKTAIDDLERARRSLQEDIDDKDKALGIDRACAAQKNAAHSDYSYGFAKVGQGQTHLADTSSSKKRQVTLAGC